MKWHHILLLALAAFLLFLLASEARATEQDRLWREGMAASAEAGNAQDEAARDAALDRAIAAFRAMLVRDPGLTRVRLELARAFFVKGEDSLARRHFEAVLAGPLPPQVAAKVHGYLGALRARKRWSVHVGAALAPDSNIGAASGGRIIMLDTPFGRLPFTLDEPAAEESGVGLALWAGGEYQHPLAPAWRLRAGGNLSRREYKGTDFDRSALGAHAGPRWLVDGDTEASLLLDARQAWAAHRRDYRDLGLRLEGQRRLTRRTALDLGASWHERRYDRREDFDGPVAAVTAGLGWTVLPVLRLDLGAGLTRERPDARRQRNDGRRLSLGATLALPLGFTAGLEAQRARTAYEGNWQPYTNGEARKDRTETWRLSLHNRALTLGGFSPRVSLVRERRRSNAQLHGYERTSGELQFVRLF